MSVEPKELDKFFTIIDNNYADFVNGTPNLSDGKESMRKINFVGNRFFQYIVSLLLVQIYLIPYVEQKF